MTENGTLSTPQRRAISSLLSERSTRSAAVAAKVAERTLWRWLSDPIFREELAKQEGAILDEATRGLLSMQGAALEVFDGVLKDKNAKDADKLRAAESVLDYLLKLRDHNDFEKRLREIEEAVDRG